ncbi:MAG: TRAP transporter small permease subunit, partial [Hydrogenophaga sp.]
DLGFRLIPRALHAPLHVLALVTLTAMATFMTVQAWGELGQTLTFGAVTNTPLQTPLWVPQGLWVAGFAFFALTAGLAALHGLILIIRAPGRVAVLYGSSSVEKEVAAYVAPTVTEETR